MFHRLSVQVSAFILFLAAVFIAYGFYYLSTLQQLAEKNTAVEFAAEVSGTLFRIQQQATNQYVSVLLFEQGQVSEEEMAQTVRSASAEALAMYEELLVDVQDAESEIQFTPEGEAIFHRIKRGLPEIEGGLRELEQHTLAMPASLAQIEYRVVGLNAKMAELIDEAELLVDDTTHAYTEDTKMLQRLSITFVVLMSLFILGFMMNLLLVFVSSLRLVVDGINKFKDGNLSHRIPLRSKSELGAIANYLNEAIDSVARAQKKQKDAERKLRDINATLEARVEERTAEIRKNEERFRHLVENLSDVVTVVDKKGVVRYQSPSIERLIGYTPDELVGTSVFAHVHKSDIAKARRAFAERRGKQGFAAPVELRLQHKDGSWRVVEAVSNNLLDDSDIRGFVVTSKDVTQRKMDEQKLRELDELKNVFIRTVSHQLRTPLNAIRWNLESLLADEVGRLRAGQRDFLRVTYQANGEIIRRIDDLLTALDIQEGRVIVKKEPGSLEDLARSVIAECHKQCELKRITLVFDEEKGRRKPISMDVEKIRSAIEKLMDNAIAYTPEGGTITVRTERAGDRARFEVTDTGIGIPKADHSKIFIRFFRGSNAAKVRPDSSGLGLSLAKYFVEQHGGTIGFTSEEGKGSTFWFELPVK